MTSPRVLVLGAEGQVGRAILRCASAYDIIACGQSKAQADITSGDSIMRALAQFKPDAVINSAAYTHVDLAEDASELCWKINAEGPGLIAKACAARGLPFIHLSTDCVFDGRASQAYREADSINPINFYGVSKACGEDAVIAASDNYLILRTSWVFDAQGRNFLNTMLKLGMTRKTLNIVEDQFGKPTFSDDIAKACLQVLVKSAFKLPNEIYHYCGDEAVSRHAFAEHIFKTASTYNYAAPKLIAIPTSQFPTPARRAKNAALNTDKFERDYAIFSSPWRARIESIVKDLLKHDS